MSIYKYFLYIKSITESRCCLDHPNTFKVKWEQKLGCQIELSVSGCVFVPGKQDAVLVVHVESQNILCWKGCTSTLKPRS